MKITIDLSKWEDPLALSAGEEVLKSTIKAFKLLQKEGVCHAPEGDKTDPIEWLEDVLWLVHQANREIRREGRRKS